MVVQPYVTVYIGLDDLIFFLFKQSRAYCIVYTYIFNCIYRHSSV